jgi:rod shape-determining protein MreC
MKTYTDRVVFSTLFWLLLINAILFTLDRAGWLHSFRSPLERITTPIQAGLSKIGLVVTIELGRPMKFRTLSQECTNLRDETNDLLVENAYLRSELDEIKQQLDLQVVLPQTEIIQAGVVESNSRLVIDMGEDDGIGEGAAVVSGDALVGVISGVSPHTAVVCLITDPSVRVPALVVPRRGVLGSERIRGLAVGKFNQEVELAQVLADEPLKEGQVVVTAGGTKIPRHLAIGEIVEIKKKEAEVFSSARVKPLVDFKRLGSVSVIIYKDNG